MLKILSSITCNKVGVHSKNDSCLNAKEILEKKHQLCICNIKIYF